VLASFRSTHSRLRVGQVSKFNHYAPSKSCLRCTVYARAAIRRLSCSRRVGTTDDASFTNR
jgi:hypothetical protein